MATTQSPVQEITPVPAPAPPSRALVHHPGQAVHGFALLNVSLAVSALAAAGMAGLSVRHRRPGSGSRST